jgi:hypothetical protein
MKIKNLISIIALAISAISVSAQVPDAIRFQTVLRDANGLLIANKSVGIRLTIEAKSGSNTTDLYAETFTTTTSLDGIATVVFGKGNVVGGNTYSSFADIDWSSAEAERWMKVEVDPNGGSNYSVISGESQLLSAPYALMAKKTAQVGSLSLAKVKVITSGDGPSVLPEVKVAGIVMTPNSGETIDVLAGAPVYLSLDFPVGYDGLNGSKKYALRSIKVNDKTVKRLLTNSQVYVSNLELPVLKNSDGDSYAYYDINGVYADNTGKKVELGEFFLSDADVNVINTYNWNLEEDADIIVGPFNANDVNTVELVFDQIIY